MSSSAGGQVAELAHLSEPRSVDRKDPCPRMIRHVAQLSGAQVDVYRDQHCAQPRTTEPQTEEVDAVRSHHRYPVARPDARRVEASRPLRRDLRGIFVGVRDTATRDERPVAEPRTFDERRWDSAASARSSRKDETLNRRPQQECETRYAAPAPLP